jgi:hypothetical protein
VEVLGLFEGERVRGSLVDVLPGRNARVEQEIGV